MKQLLHRCFPVVSWRTPCIWYEGPGILISAFIQVFCLHLHTGGLPPYSNVKH